MFDGSNRGLNAYYFKIEKPDIMNSAKLTLSIRKTDEDKSFISVQLTPENVAIDANSEIKTIEELLLKHLHQKV